MRSLLHQLLYLCATGTLLSAPLLAPAGEPFKPGKLPKDVVVALKTGLKLQFLDGAHILDTRRVRLAALHVPAGTPPSPFVDVGPFSARLSGFLKAPSKDSFTFRAQGNGSLTVRLNDREAVKGEVAKLDSFTAELARGYNKLELLYRSPEKGDATLRLLWSGEGFATEPLPPDSLFAHGGESDLAEGEQRREGRLLFATLGCARCHALPEKLTPDKCALPELQQRGPSLAGAGKRFQHRWLVEWLLNPRRLRPEATMPRVLTGSDVLQQAADIAAYLATLREGLHPIANWGPDMVADGEKLFNSIGCVTCHHFGKPEKSDPHGRLSLAYVSAKYPAGALESFLQQPHQHHPWSRMPDFQLRGREVILLNAYLRTAGQEKLPPSAGVQGPDPKRGAKLFASAGCAACHAVKAEAVFPAPARTAAVREGLSNGCLAQAEAKRGQAPDFGLTKEQTLAVRAFLSTDGSSLSRETSAEFSLRQVQLLQCGACHRRDTPVSRWHNILEEEGTLPEFLPSLMWAGEKLNPDWTTKLLAGQHDHRARPWLKARMPAFPARAELLALGLTHEHGFGAGEDERPKHHAKQAEIGAKLIPLQGGFGCSQCHDIGKQKALAPFEAPGINLVDAAQRLRYSFYHRWILDPPRLDITTRMQKFSNDGKTTQVTGVLGGEARRQYEALWHYLQTLR